MAPAYFSYSVTEVFLLFFTLNILLKLGTSLGSKAETRELRHIIYAYLAVLITDIIWAFAENDVIECGQAFLAFINGAYLCAFTALCFFWFRFASVRLKLKLRYPISRGLHALFMLPLAVSVVLIVLSMFTGWIFYIDDSGAYIHGELYIIYLFGCYFYIAVSFLLSAAAFVQARTTAKRRECLACTTDILVPFVGQQLKPLMQTAPVLHLSIFLILQLLFLTLQENQIYNDALTGLNNRRRLNHYLEEQLPTASDKRPISFFIMDMNDFKSINDTFGHVEGDRALIVVGSALKRAAAEFNSFVARYGGDEFCMVCIGNKHDEEKVAARLHEILTQTQQEMQGESVKNYTLSLCVGCAVCRTPHRTPSQVIRDADEKLHQAKQAYRGRKR